MHTFKKTKTTNAKANVANNIFIILLKAKLTPNEAVEKVFSYAHHADY